MPAAWRCCGMALCGVWLIGWRDRTCRWWPCRSPMVGCSAVKATPPPASPVGTDPAVAERRCACGCRWRQRSGSLVPRWAARSPALMAMSLPLAQLAPGMTTVAALLHRCRSADGAGLGWRAAQRCSSGSDSSPARGWPELLAIPSARRVLAGGQWVDNQFVGDQSVADSTDSP